MAHKEPDYIGKIKIETAERIYQQVMEELAVKKRYTDPGLKASQLVKELKTNPQSLSAVMQRYMGGKFNEVVNRFRVKRAAHMLVKKQYSDVACGDIGMMCGFSTRQSYYMAFKREMGMSPANYRKEKQIKNKK
ncbi:MAG: helix-turn-helix domain-containing protein [Bacteroidaceae bacterium]|nr:helix-turn-helix domain-containing protein [Bacteroidaceae bacterium]